jgi:hypothetical protein
MPAFGKPRKSPARTQEMRLKPEHFADERSVETGESEESVPTGYHRPELEIGFNAGYLLDFLRSISQCDRSPSIELHRANTGLCYSCFLTLPDVRDHF